VALIGEQARIDRLRSLETSVRPVQFYPYLEDKHDICAWSCCSIPYPVERPDRRELSIISPPNKEELAGNALLSGTLSSLGGLEEPVGGRVGLQESR